MTIDLNAGDMRLHLDPETGGAIGALTWRGIELLRPVSDPRMAAQYGRAVAAYPLIPYANRIAEGRFTLNGTTYQLVRNFGGEPHSIHGNAWMRRWSVAACAANQARLTLDHTPPLDDPAEWPFAYHAEQVFELLEDHLRVTLILQNRHAHPFPAGLGLHPYVARTPQATLRFQADTLWRTGAENLPVERIAVPEVLDFERAKPIGTTEIDTCYAGWGGTAVLGMPECRLAIHLGAAPPLDHLQVYTPPGKSYFGLEPVSNMPDAINRMETVSDQGMVLLGPWEILRAEMTIGVRPERS